MPSFHKMCKKKRKTTLFWNDTELLRKLCRGVCLTSYDLHVILQESPAGAATIGPQGTTLAAPMVTRGTHQGHSPVSPEPGTASQNAALGSQDFSVPDHKVTGLPTEQILNPSKSQDKNPPCHSELIQLSNPMSPHLF